MREQLLTDLVKATSDRPKTGLGLLSGTIKSWDAATLTGTVEVEGTPHTGLPVLSALDAFSWQAGDEVTLLSWHPPDGHRRKGFGSYMILGRVFRPSAANAAKVLQGLQNQFALQVAHEIAAATVFSAGEDANVVSGDTAGAFVALTGGPEIPDVPIGPSGRALVTVSADILSSPTGADVNVTGYMGCRVTGATTVEPVTSKALRLTFRRGDGSVSFHPSVTVAASKTSLVDGLNEGLHTFTARYRVQAFGSDEGEFFGRNLTVRAF